MTDPALILRPGNIGPHQKVNHAHIFEDAVVLHWHASDQEPERGEGVSLSRNDWMNLMNLVYWKKEESLEAPPSDDNNLIGADVHVGYVVFRYKKGRKTVEEEVSIQSLQQVDARLRKRSR